MSRHQDRGRRPEWDPLRALRRAIRELAEHQYREMGLDPVEYGHEIEQCVERCVALFVRGALRGQ